MRASAKRTAALGSEERRRALEEIEVLDRPADPALDRLTALAATVIDAPIALLTLVDERRQFFTSAHGLPEPWATRRETPLSHSFCQHVVLSRTALVIDDARAHPLVRSNLAIRDLGVIAYLGFPVMTADAVVLGSFSVCDTVPRAWTDRDQRLMREFTTLATRELSLGHATRTTSALLEQAREAFLILDAEGRITTMNRAAEEVLGADRGALIGEIAWTALPPSSTEVIEPLVHRAWAERCPLEREVTCGRAGGGTGPAARTKWLDLRVVPWHEGAALLVRDISARKEAESALRESEHRFRALAELSPDAVLVGQHGRVVYANAAAAALLGAASQAELAGGLLLDLVEPSMRMQAEDRLARALSPPAATTRLESLWVRMDGARIAVDVSCGATTWGGEPAVQVILRDVSERKHVEAERERLLAEAEAARATAEVARREAETANHAKSDFLAIMSHELRTPLNAIGGYAELLELGIRGPVTAQQQEDLGRIQKSQRHLLSLINQVLNYARLESGAVRYELVTVSVAEAVGAAEALVAPQVLAKGLHYSHQLCEDGLAVRADRAKLQQILLNLLSNAIKFTNARPGLPGHVEIVCASSPEAPSAPPRVAIAVRDTGVGIAPEKLQSVFDPFVQLDTRLTRTQEGVGLGLAISRDLARGMGGELTAASTPGVGSTFTLLLPAA